MKFKNILSFLNSNRKNKSLSQEDDIKTTQKSNNDLSDYGSCLNKLHEGNWALFNKMIAKYDTPKISNHLFKKVAVIKDCTYAIGHFIFLEAFLILKRKGLIKKKLLFLCYNCCNSAILSLFIKKFSSKNIKFTFQNEFQRDTDLYNYAGQSIYCLKLGRKTLNYLQILSLATIKNRGKPIFSKRDIPADYLKIIKHTIPNDIYKFNIPFVTLHLRAKGDSVRDVDPSSYLNAIRFLENKGFKIILIGNYTKNQLETLQTVKNLYFNNDTFCDLYYLSFCSYFIGTDSGPWVVPSFFGIPFLITNHMPISCPITKINSLILSKKIYKYDNKHIKLKDYKRLFGMSEKKDLFEAKGYCIKDNSSEEIKSSVENLLKIRKKNRKIEWESLEKKLLRQKSNGYGINFGRQINNAF